MRDHSALRTASSTAADIEAVTDIPTSADSTRPVYTQKQRAEALRFWKCVSRMWPKSWWSPSRHWQDLQLRRYAKRKIREIEGRCKITKDRTRSSSIVAVMALLAFLAGVAPSRARERDSDGRATQTWQAPPFSSPP